jgi:hypothetical protein
MSLGYHAHISHNAKYLKCLVHLACERECLEERRKVELAVWKAQLAEHANHITGEVGIAGFTGRVEYT